MDSLGVIKTPAVYAAVSSEPSEEGQDKNRKEKSVSR